MHTADVVIIGGGIVGSSIAWNLTQAGCKNVLVIEAGKLAGKRIHREEHGRSPRTVFHAREHTDVAVFNSLLCQV